MTILEPPDGFHPDISDAILRHAKELVAEYGWENEEDDETQEVVAVNLAMALLLICRQFGVACELLHEGELFARDLLQRIDEKEVEDN